MPWTAVSCYTKNSIYEGQARRLANSAREVDVPLIIYPVPNSPIWRLNLNHKSATVLQAMKDHPKSDIVWLDADAVIRHRPVLFDFLSTAQDWDIAAHFYEKSRLERRELLSGTLWIANTPKGRQIVEAWDGLGRQKPNIRHQKCLHLILDQDPKVRIYGLPASYTRIFDARGMAGVEPVIEHFQASRQFRRGIFRPPAVSPGPFEPARGPK
jgi:hypothetical protein